MRQAKTQNSISIEQRIGSRIRLRRNEIGMNQTELGEKLGVTFQQIQKYEKGTNRAGGARLVQLAVALGVGVDYFYRGIDPGNDKDVPALSAAEKFVMSAEGARIAMVFDGLNKGLRWAIVGLVEAAAAKA
jgi:transcriptional regulator with XRE-family HTH domain